jgi:hypothetical protein
MEHDPEESKKRKAAQTSLSILRTSSELSSVYQGLGREPNCTDHPLSAKKPRQYGKFHLFPPPSTTLSVWDMSYQLRNPVQQFQFQSSNTTGGSETQKFQQWVPSVGGETWKPTQNHLDVSPSLWPSLDFMNPTSKQGWDHIPRFSGASNFEEGSGFLSIPRNGTFTLAEESSSDATNDSAGK